MADFPRIRRYLMVIARGLFIAIAVFFITVGIGKYFIDRLRTVFQATAEITVEPRSGDAASADDNTLDPQAELEIIRSPLVLQPVINDLGLDRTWAARVFAVDPRQLAPAETLAYMNKILVVNFEPGTNVMEITASSGVPEEAAAIANAVADSYKIKRDAEELQIEQAHDPHKGLIRREIADAELVIDEKRAQLEALRVKLEAKGIQMDPHSADATDPGLQDYHNRERDLEERSRALDVLQAQLAQSGDEGYAASGVHIKTRAVPPRMASSPNRRLDYRIIEVIAVFLSLGIASSVEVIFLLLRAAARPES